LEVGPPKLQAASASPAEGVLKQAQRVVRSAFQACDKLSAFPGDHLKGAGASFGLKTAEGSSSDE